MTAVFLTYPLDTIRARLAFQVKDHHQYRGIVHTAVMIYKKVKCIFFDYFWYFIFSSGTLGGWHFQYF